MVFSEAKFNPFEVVCEPGSTWDMNDHCKRLGRMLFLHMCGLPGALAEMRYLQVTLMREKMESMRVEYARAKDNILARRRIILQPCVIAGVDAALAAARRANPDVFSDITLDDVANSETADPDVTLCFAQLVANYINVARYQGPRMHVPVSLGATYSNTARMCFARLRRVEKFDGKLRMLPPAPRASSGFARGSGSVHFF